jgi:glyoxylase-like metal-dependent hydrolase (beta-lactamase superfamily II)/ferredoxin
LGAVAVLAKRLPNNAPGDFYVDESCIDCGACMWIAKETFDEASGRSFVKTQPKTMESTRLAELALIACPTASIGATKRHDLASAAADYPRPFAGDDVLHCGFHDESTFGATSWLLRRADGNGRDGGNVLIDVPRFSAPLVKRIEELGGVKRLFLTHRDDVGDHAKFAAHFGCERILHEGDVTADTRDVEHMLRGEEPVELARGLLAIPTPGHTQGSACLLADEKYLFGGDHVAWSDELGHPYAFRGACWYDWGELVKSMRRLATHRFEWILPGHDAPGHLPADEMRTAMQRCVEWVERP